MGLPLEGTPTRFEEFMSWIVRQQGRHEFVGGEVFAMGGGTRAHSAVAVNVASALGRHLRGSGCRPYNSDMAVRVEIADAVYFPDVSVSCETGAEQLFLVEPKLIVEVLSPTTEAYDRGRKFRDYRTLKSLQEYVLVDPERRLIEVFRRSGEEWTLHAYGAADTIPLASVALDLPGAEVFVDVD